MIQKSNNGKFYFYGEEISEEKYEEIIEIIRNKPPKTATTDYRLREDLTWEEFEIEQPEPDPELDDSEALSIILGGEE